MTSTTHILIALLLSHLATAQILAAGMPATVFFTPYKLANCSMSTDIASEDHPSSYAVTSGRCYNSTYAFQSYAQATNFVEKTPCSFTIYYKVDCEGDENTSAELSNCAKCFAGPLKEVGESFQLTCGP